MTLGNNLKKFFLTYNLYKKYNRGELYSAFFALCNTLQNTLKCTWIFPIEFNYHASEIDVWSNCEYIKNNPYSYRYFHTISMLKKQHTLECIPWMIYLEKRLRWVNWLGEILDCVRLYKRCCTSCTIVLQIEDCNRYD